MKDNYESSSCRRKGGILDIGKQRREEKKCIVHHVQFNRNSD
jgi:hypothetical protein